MFIIVLNTIAHIGKQYCGQKSDHNSQVWITIMWHIQVYAILAYCTPSFSTLFRHLCIHARPQAHIGIQHVIIHSH